MKALFKHLISSVPSETLKKAFIAALTDKSPDISYAKIIADERKFSISGVAMAPSTFVAWTLKTSSYMYYTFNSPKMFWDLIIKWVTTLDEDPIVMAHRILKVLHGFQMREKTFPNIKQEEYFETIGSFIDGIPDSEDKESLRDFFEGKIIVPPPAPPSPPPFVMKTKSSVIPDQNVLLDLFDDISSMKFGHYFNKSKTQVSNIESEGKVSRFVDAVLETSSRI